LLPLRSPHLLSAVTYFTLQHCSPPSSRLNSRASPCFQNVAIVRPSQMQCQRKENWVTMCLGFTLNQPPHHLPIPLVLHHSQCQAQTSEPPADVFGILGDIDRSRF